MPDLMGNKECMGENSMGGSPYVSDLDNPLALCLEDSITVR